MLDRALSTLLGRSCALQDEEYALFIVSLLRGVLRGLALMRISPLYAMTKTLGSRVWNPLRSPRRKCAVLSPASNSIKSSHLLSELW